MGDIQLVVFDTGKMSRTACRVLEALKDDDAFVYAVTIPRNSKIQIFVNGKLDAEIKNGKLCLR